MKLQPMKEAVADRGNRPCPICGKVSAIGNHTKCSLELERRKNETFVFKGITKKHEENGKHRRTKKRYSNKKTLDYFSKIK